MSSIKSLPFSFVRFGESVEDFYCAGEAEYKLPAYDHHEVKFQFLVEGYLPEASELKLGVNGILFSPAIMATKVDYKHRLTLSFPLTTFYLVSFAIGSNYKLYNRTVTLAEFLELINNDFGIEAVIDGTYLVFNYNCKLPAELIASASTPELAVTMNTVSWFWHQGYIDTLEAGEIGFTDEIIGAGCFHYTFGSDPADPTSATDVLGISNQFYIVNDDCFTSLLNYACDENAFSFIYSGGQRNQVRLPFYLSRPTHPQKRTVYIKSNGKQKLLSANVEKEYQFNTDWMIELFHECMAIAFSHESVVITNNNIREKTVEVIQADNYKTDWNSEFELVSAPGSGKIKVATFGHTNSNCNTEEEDCAGGVCGVPGGLAIGSITQTSAIASWTSLGGLSVTAEIDIIRADTPGSSLAGYPLILAPGALTHQFINLEDGTAYQFRVRYHCGATQSAWVSLPADPDFETLP
jgi:hypothetical protein